MPDAIFTEVLDLTIDTASFKAGLSQLEQAYESFIQNINTMSEGAGPALGAVVGAEVAALSSQVSELGTAFKAFDQTIGAAFADTDTQLKSIQASVEATAQSAVNAKAKIGAPQANSPSTGGAAASPVAGGVGNVNAAITSAQGGLGTLIAQVAQFRLLWGAVGEVVQVVVDIIKSPFEVIKTGLEYLSRLQDQAASLQGPIAANAKFSEDLGKNFQIAGVAAHEVALELQSLAVKMGVPAEQLQHIFSDVLESGGLHFVKTMQDVVSLTEMFTLAMEKTSTDVEVQRRIMMDIPKLLDGSNVSSSRILVTLGLTNSQWQSIRSEALAHGDLLEKLSGLMAPYLTVVEQADLRQSRLIASIKLQSQIIAGAIALPLWEQLTPVLQRISGFLGTNKTALEQAGAVTVDLAAEFGKFVLELGEGLTGATSLESVFHSILETVNNLIGALRIGLEVLSTWGHEAGTIAQFAGDPLNFFSPTAIAEFNTRIDAFEKNYVAKIKEINQQGQTVARGFDVNQFFDENGQFKGAGSLSSNLLNNPVQPNKNIPDAAAEKAAAQAREDAFRATQEQFRTELSKTKETFAETEADIKARQADGTISFHEATNERVAAIHTELESVQKLVQVYTQLAASAAKSGVKGNEVQRFNATLTDVGNAAQSTATVQTTGALAADQGNDEHITQAHLERLRQMELTHSRAMLDIYKQEAADGLHTKLDVFDQEASLSAKEHLAVLATLQDELVAAGNNEKERARILDAATAEDQRYTDSISQDSRTRSAIASQEAERIQAAATKEISLRLQTTRLRAQDAIAAGQASTTVARTALIEDQATLKAAQSNLAGAKAAIANATAIGIKGDALAKLVIQEAEAEKAVGEASKSVSTDKGDTEGGQVDQEIFGKNVDDLNSAFDGFGRDVESIGNAFKFFSGAAQNLISGIKSGVASGGALGGIGAAASTIGGYIPGPAGAIVSGVGSLFSFLGGLFTAAAKRIAADIKKSVDDLMQQYSNGQTTLIQTLNGLEQERAAAIEQLSGQKGGQDQLNTLLPEIDQQIASLEQQQKQVLDTFDQGLEVLQTQSSTLGQVLQTWQQINKQVTDYINAGGDAAKAAQFMSLSLQQQQQTAQNSLNDAENNAIQDAMQLNDLLQQRVALTTQLNDQLFATANADALERNGSPALNNAIAFEQQRQANADQLTALDQQIQLYTSRVAMEKQVFDLASSTADLQAQANQLNLDALQQTIKGWQDLKAIISSITETGGIFGVNPNLFNPVGAGGNTSVVNIGAGAINVTVTGADAADGGAIAQALMDELNLLGQFGVNTSS